MNLEMWMKKYLKKDALETILVSIIFLAIGILIALNPETTIMAVSYVIGGIFILFGIFKIVNYISLKGNEDFLNYDLVFGTIGIIVGIIFIVQASLLNTILRIAVAIWLIYSGLIKGNVALKLKKFNIKAWWLALVSAILMVVAGIYVISYSGILVATLGIFMIVYAVIDIINEIIFIVDVNKYI